MLCIYHSININIIIIVREEEEERREGGLLTRVLCDWRVLWDMSKPRATYLSRELYGV